LYSTECGLKIDGRFCANCGTPVQGAEGKQMSKTTKFVAIGVIVLVALIVGIVLLAGNPSPEGTVKKFFYALEKGDLNKLVDTIDPYFLNELGEYRGFWEQQMNYVLDESSSAWEENKIKIRILDSTISGNKAEVKVQVKNREHINDDTIYLIKRGNKWYIDYELSGLDF